MEGTSKSIQKNKSKGLWARSKGLRLWLLNLVIFTCFVILSLTGLITWVILPTGYRFRDGGGFHVLRHTLIELHEWVSLVFIVLIVVHLVWHWSYITANAKRWLRHPAQ